MSDKDKNNSKKRIKTISVYLPKELRQQLMFFCKRNNIGSSTFCHRLIEWYLRRKNVTQMMIDFAMEQVENKHKENK